jgi:hypothetical protein
MAQAQLETTDFNAYHDLCERAIRKHTIDGDDAFVAAMNRAIKYRQVKVKPGTFVDRTATYARQLRGEVAISVCGSPAQMCMERAVAEAGSATLK